MNAAAPDAAAPDAGEPESAGPETDGPDTGRAEARGPVAGGRTRVEDLVDAARSGRARAVGRLISLIEDNAPTLREVARALAPYAGRAEVVGVTGAPGVGKSTLTAALVGEYRQAGHRVGVLAVDPTSPFSGGALLGDRVRMQQHATDPDVLIRSMATRGRLGGLAAATPQALRVFDAAGCSVSLVETVGVGQSEVDIAGLADTTLVLVAPGMGDSVQAAKAGILEVGDVYVVAKADREGADRVSRDLRHMLGLGTRNRARDPHPWVPPIVQTSAVSGKGIADVVDAIARHRVYLRDSGELTRIRRERVRSEIEALAFAALRARAGELPDGDVVEGLVVSVLDGRMDPYTAADQLLDAVLPGYD